jgi:general secretion pathway protein A
MYLDFYQLKKAPFHITPDPEFLFLSPSHKAALGAIIYGIEERQGFVAITGEVGLGKTTILRSYLERINSRQLRTIYIFNANISFRSLLKLMYQEFGLDTEDIVLFDDEDLFELVNRLHQALLQEYKSGRNVALIIDEAQNMPAETLENLRMLSNLETATEKLIQIVLLGQPEFEHKLDLHELRQLKQRLVIHATIAPLTAEESLAYIHHRWSKVALAPAPVFTKGAAQRLIAAAQGTPRTLNILCTNALIAGYGYHQRPITAKTVQEVIDEFLGKKSRPRLRPAFVGLAALLVGTSLFLASPYGNATLLRLAEEIPWHSLPEWPRLPQPGFSTTRWQQAPAPQPSGSTEELSAAPRYQPVETLSEQLDAVKEAGKDNEEAGQELPTSSVPKAPMALPEVRMTEPPLVRTLNKGDSVSKIAAQVYGMANDAIFEFIKKHNPHIQDVNKVAIGTKIVLPKLPPATE